VRRATGAGVVEGLRCRACGISCRRCLLVTGGGSGWRGGWERPAGTKGGESCSASPTARKEGREGLAILNLVEGRSRVIVTPQRARSPLSALLPSLGE
jgi:hypothetical protein